MQSLFKDGLTKNGHVPSLGDILFEHPIFLLLSLLLFGTMLQQYIGTENIVIYTTRK